MRIFDIVYSLCVLSCVLVGPIPTDIVTLTSLEYLDTSGTAVGKSNAISRYQSVLIWVFVCLLI